MRAMALDAADEGLYRGILVIEVIVIPQVVPDALGAQAFGYRCLDDMAVRLTGALRAGRHPGGLPAAWGRSGPPSSGLFQSHAGFAGDSTLTPITPVFFVCRPS